MPGPSNTASWRHALLASMVLTACAAGQASPQHVVERDLLQSRAMTLVLHHATAVANPDALPAAFDVLAPVPPALDRKGRFWPRFDTGAAPALALAEAGVPPPLAALPLVAPGPPSRQDGASPGYRWRAQVPGGHWLVAGVTNYYGAASRLLVAAGLQQVLGLQIRSQYAARLENGIHVLRMAIELRNVGDRPLHEVQFRLCFSGSLAGVDAAPPQRLFVTTSHRVDGAAAYSATAHADGLGRRATAGHAATALAPLLLPGEARTFAMELRGHLADASAELHPAYLIGMREAPGGERLWPASVITGAGADLPRFYYRQAALLLPAPYRFSLSASQADVSAMPPSTEDR